MTLPAALAIVAMVAVGDLMLWVRVGTVVAALGVLALLLGGENEEDAKSARGGDEEAIEVHDERISADGPVTQKSLSSLVRNRR